LINAAPARELRRTSDSEMDMSESTERREKARRRVLKRALIVFNRGHCSIRCQILNISEFGAQVMPSDILLCPSEFVLKPEVGDQRNCEVAWRKGTTIGVRFV
jgi:hypothetical protein